MNLASFLRTILRNLLGGSLIFLAFAAVASGQVQTQTEVQKGPSTREVTVQRGQVVYVAGNELVIREEGGTYRDFPNVPDSARVTVDGQQLSVHDLQPGMIIERTTITTTTPRVITTIKSVTGTVWSVTPPTSVILTLEDGKNQEFTIPNGTKFTVDGQPTDAFSLKPGMKVSATSVTEVPETVVRQRVRTTGEMPPAPDLALLVVVVVPAATLEAPAETAPAQAEPTPAQTAPATPAETAPAQLPKTASPLPLAGLLGGVFCCLALGLRTKRNFGRCPVVSRKRLG
jgi:hypothetical protein